MVDQTDKKRPYLWKISCIARITIIFEIFIYLPQECTENLDNEKKNQMNLIIHKNLHPNVETKCTTNHKDSEYRCYCYVPQLFNIPDN